MVTIRDVARESGVSVATVSYVINNGPRPVKAETRQLVLETMERLGYHPSAVAQALVRGRVNTLGILFGKVEPAIVTNEYVTSVLRGVMVVAAWSGYNVTLYTQPWTDGATSAPPFKDGRCDGVVILAPLRDSDMVESLTRLNIPLVVISASDDLPDGALSVDVQNAAGAMLATNHLIELGHTRIAHFMGEERQASVPERRHGFCQAMAAAGLEVPPEYLVRSAYNAPSGFAAAQRILTPRPEPGCSNKPPFGYTAARGVLALPQRPTAIFAGNDGIALGVLEAARELGIAVPDELSVVGFDDIPAAALVSPALTTIRQPLAEMGERATQMLIAQIEGRQTGDLSYRAEPELIIRGSTAPCTGSLRR